MLNDRTALRGALEAAQLIGLVRTKDPLDAVALGNALLRGGFRAIEVSFTTPQAPEVIATLSAQNDALVGAGTVLQPEQALAALVAGAKFLVAPVQPPHLVSMAHEAGRVAIVGGLTPNEIQSALDSGADFAKVFPVQAMGGPSYLKDLLAPFPHWPLLVSGGVDCGNFGAFLEAGARLVVMGSAAFPARLVADRDWGAISTYVSSLLRSPAAVTSR